VNFLDSDGRTPLDVSCNWGSGTIWRLIQTILEKSDKPYDVYSLTHRLEVIFTLLDNGGRRAHRPQPRRHAIEEDRNHDGKANLEDDDEESYPITEEVLQDLAKKGIRTDRRLLDLPRLQPDKPSLASQALSALSSLFKPG
jgi:hypothetical protein